VLQARIHLMALQVVWQPVLQDLIYLLHRRVVIAPMDTIQAQRMLQVAPLVQLEPMDIIMVRHFVQQFQPVIIIHHQEQQIILIAPQALILLQVLRHVHLAHQEHIRSVHPQRATPHVLLVRSIRQDKRAVTAPQVVILQQADKFHALFVVLALMELQLVLLHVTLALQVILLQRQGPQP
jgi:hypothetical protein